MKTRIFLFFAALFFSAASFGQGFSLGIKGGANMGKIGGESFKNEFKLGYQVGGFAIIPLGKKFAIQPEVVFNQTNVDTSSQFSDIYHFNQINHIQLKQLLIPILVNYSLTRHLALQAGPQFDVVLDQNKNLLQNGGDAFKSGNFSMAAGLQLSLMQLKIYGRFTGGMTNLDNIGTKDTWKPQNIQLGIGLAF